MKHYASLRCLFSTIYKEMIMPKAPAYATKRELIALKKEVKKMIRDAIKPKKKATKGVKRRAKAK